MRRSTAPVLFLLVLALISAACTSSSSSDGAAVEESSTTVEPVQQTTSTTAIPASEPDDEPGGVRPTADGDEAKAQLAALLALQPDPSPLRIELSQAQSLALPLLGIDNVQELDESSPTMTTEVDLEGRTFTVMNVGPSFLLAIPDPTAEVLAIADQLVVTSWYDGADLLVFDTRSYAPAEERFAADFGAFASGVWSVELAALPVPDPDQAVAALVGATVPDRGRFGDLVVRAVDALRVDGSDPNTFHGTILYGDLVRAQGGEVETLALGAATGLASVLGIDPQPVTDLYVELYEATPADISVTIGADGGVDRYEAYADLSVVYEAMFDPDYGLAAAQGLSQAEWEEGAELFADAETSVHVVATFAPIEAITWDLPVEPWEDRTLAVAQLFGG